MHQIRIALERVMLASGEQLPELLLEKFLEFLWSFILLVLVNDEFQQVVQFT